MQDEGTFEVTESLGEDMLAVERVLLAATTAVDAFVKRIVPLDRLRRPTLHSAIISRRPFNSTLRAAFLRPKQMRAKESTHNCDIHICSVKQG